VGRSQTGRDRTRLRAPEIPITPPSITRMYMRYCPPKLKLVVSSIVFMITAFPQSLSFTIIKIYQFL
ncbi:MAG: hypothetical protein KAS98_01250, partial [Deltaproteobacteria bacterium]|nr:hypothetical protein [Deltaproteobacteria bacterium]